MAKRRTKYCESWNWWSLSLATKTVSKHSRLCSQIVWETVMLCSRVIVLVKLQGGLLRLNMFAGITTLVMRSVVVWSSQIDGLWQMVHFSLCRKAVWRDHAPDVANFVRIVEDVNKKDVQTVAKDAPSRTCHLPSEVLILVLLPQSPDAEHSGWGCMEASEGKRSLRSRVVVSVFDTAHLENTLVTLKPQDLFMQLKEIFNESSDQYWNQFGGFQWLATCTVQWGTCFSYSCIGHSERAQAVWVMHMVVIGIHSGTGRNPLQGWGYSEP